MSGKNLEVVKRRYEAFNARDLDTYLALSDPDVIYRQPAELPGARSYVGHDGLRDYFVELASAWSAVSAEVEAFIERNNAIVSVGTTRYRGRSSGAEVQKPFAIVWRLRDGKVVSGDFYFDRDAAIAATDERMVADD